MVIWLFVTKRKLDTTKHAYKRFKVDYGLTMLRLQPVSPWQHVATQTESPNVLIFKHFTTCQHEGHLVELKQVPARKLNTVLQQSALLAL
jgi:hypothetical protein